MAKKKSTKKKINKVVKTTDEVVDAEVKEQTKDLVSEIVDSYIPEESVPTEKEKIVENKDVKFNRLFTNRINKSIKQLENIGKLANSNNYEINQDLVDNGFALISEEFEDLKVKFELIFNKKQKRHL